MMFSQPFLQNKISLVFLLLWFLTSVTTFSQDLSFSFSHLGEDEGLLDNRFNDFVSKDSKGFIWISSMQGFFRFDGHQAKHYNVNVEENYNQNIQSRFYEDEKCNLWFTTEDGLHCYIRKTEKFKSRRFVKDDEEIKQLYHAFNIHKSSNTLWLTSTDYVWAYDVESDTMKSDFIPTVGMRFGIDTFSSGQVKNIFSFPWKLKKGFSILTQSGTGDWTQDTIDGGIFAEIEVSYGIPENDSTLWLITDAGLINFDRINKKERAVYTVHESTDSRLWSGLFLKEQLIVLSTRNNGLWIFDTSKKEFVSHIESNLSQKKSLSSNSPRELYLFDESQLWVEHPSLGLDYASIISHYFFNPFSFQDSKVRCGENSIVEDFKGRIWVLTETDGLFVFDTLQNLLHQFNQIDEYPFYWFKHLSINDKGQVFLIVAGNIYQYQNNHELDSTHWKRILKTEEELVSLYHGIDEDLVVISTTGAYSLEQTIANPILTALKPFESYKNFEFLYWYKLDENSAIVPFHNNRIPCLVDFENGVLSIKDSVNLDGKIFDVKWYEEELNAWIATDKGLFKSRIIEDEIDEIEYVDLGAHMSVYAVEKDNIGTYWLSTNNGIWNYDAETEELLKYTVVDGLSSNLFKKGSSLLASNGNIWFGNENGLTVFNPKEIISQPTSVTVYVNRFWVNEQPYTSDSIAINELDDINLKYDQNTVGFDLRTIGDKPTSDTHIQYRLLNYEDEWARLNVGGVGRFTKVPSGEYVLEARSVDCHNQIGESKKIKIHIATPFWKTWWFRLGALLLAVLIAFGATKFYFSQQLKEQKQLLEKQRMISEERDRIAKELHDDMGGGLASVVFLTEDILYEENEGEKTTQIKRISTLAQEALGNMKDIVWVLDNDQSTLDDLITRIQSYSIEFLSDHHIELEYSDKNILKGSVLLSSEKKRNILLIVKECLHNIVKHSAARQVDFSITRDERLLKIRIDDNGRGFDVKKDSLGNGLKNITHRSNLLNAEVDISSTPSEGTSIIIGIPL